VSWYYLDNYMQHQRGEYGMRLGRFKRHLAVLTTALSLIAALGIAVQSQPGSPASSSCSALVQLALQEVGNSCSGLDRNSACYGYNRVNASFAETVEDDFFSTAGDRAALRQLLSIATAPLSEETDEWGVAVMNVQANVPGALPGQAVTFILLGDVSVQNAVDPTSAQDAVVVSELQIGTTNARVRTGPGSNFNAVGAIAAGDTIQADGVSSDGGWVRLNYNGLTGWVSKSLIGSGDMSGLPTISPDGQTPMQAFYFSTGLGAPTCQEAPDALVIQGPENVKVNLNVNGADIEIGSTVVLKNNKTGSYNDIKRDPELQQIFGSQLNGNVPDSTDCTVTEMIMLDGEALLNGNQSVLLPGFGIRSLECGGGVDDEGEETPPTLKTSWRGSRRLSQDELSQYAILEQLPSDILRYPIDIPTDAEITRIYNRRFPQQPAATAEGTLAPGETPQPTEEGGTGPIPTVVTPEVTP
jgi:hypothetical protein